MDEDLVVKVLFDFEYCDGNGESVRIRRGEELFVVQKTNADWWQVIRSRERKPFYAPTLYFRVQLADSGGDNGGDSGGDMGGNSGGDSGVRDTDRLQRGRASIRDSRRAPISLDDAEKHISSECLPLLGSNEDTAPVQSADVSPTAGAVPVDQSLLSDNGDSAGACRDTPSDTVSPAEVEAAAAAAAVSAAGGANSGQCPAVAPRSCSTFSSARSSRVELASQSGGCRLSLMGTSFSGRGQWSRRPPASPLTGSSGPGSSADAGQGRRMVPTGSCDRLRAAPGKVARPLDRSSLLSRSVDQLPFTATAQQAQMGSEQPPMPHMLDTPRRYLGDGWEEHWHPGTARPYYYNPDTGVSRWKPPRQAGTASGSPDSAANMAPTVGRSQFHVPRDSSSHIGRSVSHSMVPVESPSTFHLPFKSTEPIDTPTAAAAALFYGAAAAVGSCSDTGHPCGSTGSRRSVLHLPLSSAPGDSARPLLAQCSSADHSGPGATSSSNMSWIHFDSGEKLVIVKQGALSHTRTANESGRRVRKNWSVSHVVLTDTQLLLFKNTRTAAHMQCGVAGTRPDTCVELGAVSVTWQPEKSSRSNVFQIATANGLQLLLQDNSWQAAHSWFEAICAAVTRLKRTSMTSTLTLISNGSAPPERKFSPLHRSRKDSATAGSAASTPEDSPDVPTGNSIRELLRRFFRSRPQSETLRKQGILRDEPVFGCELETLCAIEDSVVPRFVRECVAAIEARPNFMRVVGLYRVSANLSLVQTLRFNVDQEKYDVVHDQTDVHVLTGALKLFFRELRQPLIPFQQLPETLKLSNMAPDSQLCADHMQLLFTHLPRPNAHTLHLLLQHLNKVVALFEENRMDSHNIATVFGPTLMWSETASDSMAVGMMQQNMALDCMLNWFRLRGEQLQLLQPAGSGD